MTATYRSDHAADPELFERLMRERYGPLDKVMAERDRPRPPAPARRRLMAAAHQSTPDPDVAERDNQPAEVGERTSTGLTSTKRPPPHLGAVWCYACDGWCSPHGICGCNNR